MANSRWQKHQDTNEETIEAVEVVVVVCDAGEVAAETVGR
jgi:hypothetical protein